MTTPYYQDASVTLLHGDSLEVLPTLPDASVDVVATDPPYNLRFMGRDWDDHRSAVQFQRWCLQWSRECLRVLKPGGHMLAFGGTRTWHRLACAVEDAGFEIRDSIAYLFGSGFPKSLNVGAAIMKRQGLDPFIDPWTPEAEQWRGFGSAMKPAFEPIVVARKPLQGTVAGNVLAHGTGALNIDACRIAGDVPTTTRGRNQFGSINDDGWEPSQTGNRIEPNAAGRWPANVVLDDASAAELDEQSGDRPGFAAQNFNGGTAGKAEGWGNIGAVAGERREGFNDTGGASRFFYTAKAGSDERITHAGTSHPTVKPLSLMRWLVRLATPPGGVILEPFAGSGTTVEAAILEGFRCIAIEREADYLPLITQRIHRRRDPVAYLTAAGDDLGLFDEEPA